MIILEGILDQQESVKVYHDETELVALIGECATRFVPVGKIVIGQRISVGGSPVDPSPILAGLGIFQVKSIYKYKY